MSSTDGKKRPSIVEEGERADSKRKTFGHKGNE